MGEESRQRLDCLLPFAVIMAGVSLVVLSAPGLLLALSMFDGAPHGGLFGFVESLVAPLAITWAPFLAWSGFGVKAFVARGEAAERSGGAWCPRVPLGLIALPVVSAAYLGAASDVDVSAPLGITLLATVSLVALAPTVRIMLRGFGARL